MCIVGLRKRLRGREGEQLLRATEPWPTTLVIFSHEVIKKQFPDLCGEDFAGAAGLSTFSQLWRRVEEALKSTGVGSLAVQVTCVKSI